MLYFVCMFAWLGVSFITLIYGLLSEDTVRIWDKRTFQNDLIIREFLDDKKCIVFMSCKGDFYASIHIPEISEQRRCVQSLHKYLEHVSYLPFHLYERSDVHLYELLNMRRTKCVLLVLEWSRCAFNLSGLLGFIAVLLLIFDSTDRINIKPLLSALLTFAVNAWLRENAAIYCVSRYR